MKSKCTNALISLIIIASTCFGCNPKLSQKRPGDILNGNVVDLCVPDSSARGIYHWKTTFNLTSEELDFLKEHDINKLYVRMFDVGMEEQDQYDIDDVIPLGTTVFNSQIPDNCNVIPTVYITLKALKAYEGRETELADLIIERVYAMASWNELGDITEIQFDCDWTSTTRPMYECFCNHARKVLNDKGAILSGTIRLHQIEEAYYPFDKGVVMIYNTGSLYDANATNSILDYDDVSKYLSVENRINKFLAARKDNCPLMEIAYPTYGWGVVYDYDDNFKRLISRQGENDVKWNEWVRWETSEIDEVIRVKELVDNTIGRASNGNIIYHLDIDNLSKYSDDEIENIYN